MLTDLKKIKYHETIIDTLGNTPLVKLNKITRGYKGHYFAKVESFNPGGSVKDRIGLEIIEEAEREGRLRPGGTIVEATSGNTGLGLAIVAAIKGYKTVFTMPDKMSIEKIRLLRAFGAEVIVTPTAVPHDSPESYTEVAKRIVRETPNSILANQYFNPKNPEAHYKTTGPEIWEQTGGQIDYFICSVGTGGTISGAGKFLKEKNPNIKVVGIDPKGSILREYFYTKSYPHVLKTYKVEGIGQDWIPGTMNFEVVDDMVEATDKESFLMARRLTREEGIFVGGSCGTAMAGALKYADRMKDNDVMVILLPDTGERYLSKIYNDDWMRENGFLIPDRITARYVLQSKAKNVQQLIAIDPTTTVRKALDLFKENDVSQLPVVEKGKPVGTVIDNALMSAVLDDRSHLDQSVSKLMEPAFPVVGAAAPIEHVIDFLKKKDSAVLIEEDHKIVGILTRYDVIEYMAR
ncbi:MAG: cystathionine beta-synthase [Ignavibacteria bacterium]|nr:cystathionine beta-synthase [Ignavibacteria bacterium]MBI3765812.1 cystathionine beta-synthase [Ignavibacteriales bacterium]